MPSRNAHWTAQKKAGGLRFLSESLLLSWSHIRMIHVSYCQERDIIVERQKTQAWEHLQRSDRSESSGLLPSYCSQSNCSQCNWSLSVVSLTSKTVSLGCSSFADEHSFGCRLYRCSFKAKYFISDSRWGKNWNVHSCEQWCHQGSTLESSSLPLWSSLLEEFRWVPWCSVKNRELIAQQWSAHWRC